MIAINELKLDNWVIHYRIGNCQINGIQLHSSGDTFVYLFREGMEFQHREKITDIDPIPLTPSILEKCGFGLYYDDTFESEKYYRMDGFNQLSDYGGQSMVLTNNGNYLECGYYCNQITCDNLHQLQNLYFALTGEELGVTM